MSYNLSTTWAVILGIITLWEMIWKGFALWKASHRQQSGWFVALLIINSAGMLPIAYLLLTKDQETSKQK